MQIIQKTGNYTEHRGFEEKTPKEQKNGKQRNTWAFKCSLFVNKILLKERVSHQSNDTNTTESDLNINHDNF